MFSVYEEKGKIITDSVDYVKKRNWKHNIRLDPLGYIQEFI